MRKLLAILATILLTGAVLAATVVAVAPQAGTIASAVGGDPTDIDLTLLDAYAVRSQVFARDGSVLATLHGPENREPVPLATVPVAVVDAVLAVEDADFYAHNGVNFRAMARALFENVSAGGVEQGGSTITQQLVKNALLTSDRDLDRKSKEIPLALRLEQQLTKDEILERYLNTVYFGAGAYGVQAAAETYWGVGVTQLGYPEAAMLAALIANPVAYDPTLYPEVAYDQRRLALDRMVVEHKITVEEAAAYRTAPLPVRRCGLDERSRPASCGDLELPPPEDYFVESVKQQLLDDPRFGATREERISAVFGGGLRIHTTLDPGMQFAAELAHAAGVPPNTKGVTAAMVTVENANGAVRALVGGPGYEVFQYDVATLKPGQPTGSAFKIFTLLTALEQGNLPSDIVLGGGAFACPGCDKNPYVVSGGGGSLTSITTSSSNGAYVRLAQVVGIQNVIDQAFKLGVTTPLSPDLSMTLGPQNITPLEMASAYSALPNGGERHPPYFIERVEDRRGRLLYRHEAEGQQAVSARSACYASEILVENVKSGTGTRARLPRHVAAGKTGTAENNYDAWFVGFTSFFTTAVWMGNPDEDISMENLNGVATFGGTYPAAIWKRFNEAVHAELPPVPFATCPKPDHFVRPVVGQGNPFLNGVRFGPGGIITGGGSGTRSSTTTTTADPDGGPPPDPTTTTTAPPPSSTTSTTTQNQGGNNPRGGP